MQYSNFTRVETTNKITFSTLTPLIGIKNIKYFKDNSSGSFVKKELRWSFNGDYWSSWENLNQGNISNISIGSNKYLFLEIRYLSSGSGKVTSFTLYYDGSAQPIETSSSCNIDSSTSISREINTSSYDSSNTFGPDNSLLNADTLNGKYGEYYLWRPNQKGEQPISSITNLQQILNNLSNGYLNSITNGYNIDGDGIGVFYQKSDQNLVFKRIVGGEGTNVTESNGIITLSVDASVISKDPSIDQLYEFYNSLESDLWDLSIYIDSKFIQVDNSINWLINNTYTKNYIDASFGDISSKIDAIDLSINELYNLDSSALSGISNIGGGTGEIFKEINSDIAELRTIVAGNANVVVTTVGDQIKISLDASVSGAPVWTDTDPVSSNVGGISNGDIINTDSNSIEILERILYEYNPPNVNLYLDPSPGYYEKWNTAYDVSIYGNFNNNDFVKVRITDVSAYDTLNGGIDTISYSDVSNGSFGFLSTGNANFDDVVYSIKIYNKVNSIIMEPLEASAGISYINPYFYGIVNDTINSSNITESDITALNKLLVPNQTNEIHYDVSANYVKMKFVYAYPEEYGNINTIFDVKNDFNVTSAFDSSIINLNLGSSPSPIPYIVLIKNHWISFTQDVSIFKLVFNI